MSMIQNSVQQQRLARVLRAGPADLLGDSASPVTLGTSYGTPSDGVQTFGAEWAVLYVFVDAANGAGQIDLQIQTSDIGTDWTPLTTESISSGAAPQSDYEPQRTFTGSGLILALPLPVRGVPWLRVLAKADAGTPDIYIRYSLGS